MLVITYLGNSTTVPLALNYFVLRGAPFSNSTPTSTSVQVPSGTLSNSSTTIHRKPTGAIVGGVLGGLILILLLLSMFFFVRSRNNRRSQALSEMPYASPSPDVVTPFTVPPSNPTPPFLPQNYASNGQSFPSQNITSKFTQRGQPSDPAITSGIGGIPPLTPPRPQFSYTGPSPNVVTPFTVPPSNPTPTFLPQNYTSNGQSLPSQNISSKFTQRGQPSDPAITSSSGGIPRLTPLRPQFSPTAFIPPSSSLPLTGSHTNFDGTRTRNPQAATEPLAQQSPSPEGANTRLLRHDDSGVRIAEDNVLELPPFYTPL